MKKIIIISISFFAVWLLIGPFDFLTHGYFSELIAYEEMVAEDFTEYIDLENQEYQMQFMPAGKHFAGFVINVVNQPENNTGWICLRIYDKKEELVDTMEVDLGKVTAGEWYRTYSHEPLKEGEVYTLRISAQGCETTPYLQLISKNYLIQENISDNLLIGYAYKESTFSFQEKVLISMFMFAAWLGICSLILQKSDIRKFAGYLSFFIFLTTVLSWNYMYNTMNYGNDAFGQFETYSETLVTGVIEAEHDHIGLSKYGLGRYWDVCGELNSYYQMTKTNEDWINGYAKNEAAITVNKNFYTEELVTKIAYARFPNGSVFPVREIKKYEEVIEIYLLSEKPLRENQYGSITEVIFYDSDNTQLPTGAFRAYRSQFGLQGKIFRHMVRHMEYENAVVNLNLLCSIITSVVFMLIVGMLAVKYNILLAGCFYITFWLSPWIVNFARNLYWVEFTWFIPMALGLFCAWKIENKKCRIFSYCAVFVAIMGKCLCGYEYISSIMSGMISFLIIEFIKSLHDRNNKERQKKCFIALVIMGISALSGFAAAMCIHANLKGSGDIWEGIQLIFKEDVIRRTSGGDLNEFGETLWESFNASVWEVLCRYFHFSTEIIAGIKGSLFPLLSVVPIGIFIQDFRKKKLDVELVSMYILFFLTSVSWLVLAKSHSFVHVHMNYVLWYLGFVQISIYIIIHKLANICAGLKKN